MILASVGVGGGTDAYKAGAEAVTQALSGLPNKKANAILMFGSIAFDQDKLISGASSVNTGAILVGCSTAGEISSEGFSSEKTVVALGIVSDQMQFWGHVGNHILWNAKQAGEDYAKSLEYDSHGYATSALTFIDILQGKGDQTIKGILERLGENFPIYGGAAGDDMLFFQTYQYLGDKAYSGSVVGMGFSGNYHTGASVMHGFLPIGLSRKVTKSNENTLYTLDDKPAISIYEDYFGEEHMGMLREGLLPSLATSYPLGIFQQGSNEVILRNPVFVDEHGAITFTASIPEGSEVRLMISDKEENLEVARLVATTALKKLGEKNPQAAIVISSVARKKMFGTEADKEIEVIQKVIGRDVPMVGFYSYAQIGDQQTEGIPFHNGSLLVWLLAE